MQPLPGLEEKLIGENGPLITRLNYIRPKWFGGMFGKPESHNKAGNCRYNP